MICKNCDYYIGNVCVCIDDAHFETSPNRRCVFDDDANAEKLSPWECENSRIECGSYICNSENIPCAQIHNCKWR